MLLYNSNMNEKITVLQKNFIKRGFEFEYFEDCTQAIDYVINLIPPKSSIGFGGSVTVTESGLLDALNKNDYVLWHRNLHPELSHDEIFNYMYNSDWYITSTNALCETGDLVNIDGRGNRVSAMLNGPKNLIVICGINKIVPDINAGIERTRNVASPKNCVRLNKKTPCAITGKCSYCNSPDTICKATVIHHHPTTGTKVKIILINKNLGY